MKVFVLLAVASLSLPAVVRGQTPPYRLEELIVTATPTPRAPEAVSSSVTVLNGAALRARGLTRVQDALAEVPGVAIVQNGSYGSVTSLFMRGAESDHVLVLVDGVQINQPGGGVDLAGLTLENVERVEIVRGPGSALYGSDAVAGVIQIVTRSGREGGVRGSASARVGTYGRREWTAESSGGGERAGFSLAVSRQRGDGILQFNNAHDNTVLSGSLRFAPDDRTSSRLTLRVGDRAYHFPTEGSGVPVDRNAFSFGDETSVGATLGRALNERVSVRAFIAVNEVDGGTDDAADSPEDTLGYYGLNSLDHTRRASIDVRATARLGQELLTAGGEVETERQRSFTETESEYGPSADRSAFSRRNKAGYVHVSGARGRLSYDLGSRFEDNERFGRLATWQVGGALRLVPDGRARLRASAGSAIKEPTFFENYATGFARGNPDLDPERAISWEIGVDGEAVGGHLTLSATWFDQALRDLIQYTFVTASPSDPNFFNVAEADARGLELGAGLQGGAFSGSLAWTWLHTEVVDAGYDDGPGATFVAGEPLLRRPANTLSVRLAYALADRARLSGGATWSGARADRDFSTFPAAPVTLPAHVDVTAGANVILVRGRSGAPGLTLTLRAENLLDEEYQDVFGYAAPGRALMVGLRVPLGGGS